MVPSQAQQSRTPTRVSIANAKGFMNKFKPIYDNALNPERSKVLAVKKNALASERLALTLSAI